MSWCEDNRVDYVFGLARNERLRRRIEQAMRRARPRAKRTGQPARVFTEFRYRTTQELEPGAAGGGQGRAARGQGESALRGDVTGSLRLRPRALYENLYCARGEMENRIKEQLLLFADRMSAETMRANQLRLYSVGGGLRAGARAAAAGAEGHRVGAGAGDHDPAAAAENRRPGSLDGAAGFGFDGQRLSLARPVRLHLEGTKDLGFPARAENTSLSGPSAPLAPRSCPHEKLTIARRELRALPTPFSPEIEVPNAAAGGCCWSRAVVVLHHHG